MYKLTKDDQSHIKQITKSIMNSQVQEIWATEKVEVTKIIINYSDIFSQSKDDVKIVWTDEAQNCKRKSMNNSSTNF